MNVSTTILCRSHAIAQKCETVCPKPHRSYEGNADDIRLANFSDSQLSVILSELFFFLHSFFNRCQKWRWKTQWPMKRQSIKIITNIVSNPNLSSLSQAPFSLFNYQYIITGDQVPLVILVHRRCVKLTKQDDQNQTIVKEVVFLRSELCLCADIISILVIDLLSVEC